jgi:WD40 repeat protein
VNGFGETMHALAFTSDGRHVVGRGNGGYVAILSRDTGATIHQFTVPDVSSVAGAAVTLSPDGRTLALGSKDGIVLADIQSHQALCTLPFPAEMAAVNAVAYASDDRMIAASAVTPHGECRVYLWQVHEGVAVPSGAGEAHVEAVAAPGNPITPALRQASP